MSHILAGPIDLGIIIDTSDHGGQFDNGKLTALKEQVITLIGALHVSKLGHHVGLVSSSSTEARVVSALDAFHNEAELKESVNQVQSSSGVMNMASALAMAQTDLFGKSYRPYARKVLLVLVAGDLPEDDSVRESARKLRSSGVLVVTIAINFKRWTSGIVELNKIVTFADKRHVIPGEMTHLSKMTDTFKTYFFIGKLSLLLYFTRIETIFMYFRCTREI